MEVQEKTNFSICGFTIKEGHVVVVYCILNETSMHLHKFSGGSWNGEVISHSMAKRFKMLLWYAFQVVAALQLDIFSCYFHL